MMREDTPRGSPGHRAGAHTGHPDESSEELAMAEAVIVAATRTPIGRAGKGSLVDVRPDDLAAGVIRAALDQVPALDPAELDDIYVGCAYPQDEQGGNLARRVGVMAGLDGVPAGTINRFWASSVQTTPVGV